MSFNLYKLGSEDGGVYIISYNLLFCNKSSRISFLSFNIHTMAQIQPAFYASKPIPAILLQAGGAMPVTVITCAKLTYAFLKTSKDFIK